MSTITGQIIWNATMDQNIMNVSFTNHQFGCKMKGREAITLESSLAKIIFASGNFSSFSTKWMLSLQSSVMQYLIDNIWHLIFSVAKLWLMGLYFTHYTNAEIHASKENKENVDFYDYKIFPIHFWDQRSPGIIRYPHAFRRVSTPAS